MNHSELNYSKNERKHNKPGPYNMDIMHLPYQIKHFHPQTGKRRCNKICSHHNVSWPPIIFFAFMILDVGKNFAKKLHLNYTLCDSSFKLYSNCIFSYTSNTVPRIDQWLSLWRIKCLLGWMLMVTDFDNWWLASWIITHESSKLI